MARIFINVKGSVATKYCLANQPQYHETGEFLAGLATLNSND
jgi:hypothetical protein